MSARGNTDNYLCDTLSVRNSLKPGFGIASRRF